MGILLGEPSQGVVDVDLDAPEAVKLADYFLPATGFIFGRKSKPRSHRFYRTDKTRKSVTFPAHDGKMLVELRSSGQTVAPPSTHPSGERVEFDQTGEPAQISRDELEKAVARLAAACQLARNWPKAGSRQEAALSLSGALLRSGWSVPDAQTFVRAVAEAAGDEEADKRADTVAATSAKLEAGDLTTGWTRLSELIGQECVERAQKWLGTKHQTTRVSVDAPTALGQEALSDCGNAQRLVRRHGEDLLYCHGLGWCVWDSRQWAADATGEVIRRAKDTVRAIPLEAAGLSDDDRRKLLKHALNSEGARQIKAMISLAESEPSVSVTPRELDADPFLLNVANGTLDLRTGTLHPHRREDRITKLAPVVYVPDARLRLFDEFLDTVTDGDAEFKAFLQQICGYALTGDTSEEKLFIIHGPGATGKSTLVEAMKTVLGDYATTADFETFLDGSRPGGPRNDIARLAGARLVTASEVDDGRRLNHAIVKQMTGRDTVTARLLYREASEFTPQCKIFLVSNDLPTVRANDSAMWRRIVRVPFEHTLPETSRNPQVKSILCNPEVAGPAILAWAVQGCLAWQREGLRTPGAVQASTAAYRSAMDPVQRFLDDCCITDPQASEDSALLHRSYIQWCEVVGEESISKTAFGAELKMRGFTPTRTCSARRWKGIGLRGPQTQVA